MRRALAWVRPRPIADQHENQPNRAPSMEDGSLKNPYNPFTTSHQTRGILRRFSTVDRVRSWLPWRTHFVVIENCFIRRTFGMPGDTTTVGSLNRMLVTLLATLCTVGSRPVHIYELIVFYPVGFSRILIGKDIALIRKSQRIAEWSVSILRRIFLCILLPIEKFIYLDNANGLIDKTLGRIRK